MKLKIQKIVTWPLCIIFLIGAAFSASGEVLCIGDNGHFEFETYCLPCCGESEEFCETDMSDDQHNEHNDCSNCSDVELDNLFWSKLSPNVNTLYIVEISSSKIINSDNSFKLLKNNSSHITAYGPTHGQGPPPLFMASTVLLC